MTNRKTEPSPKDRGAEEAILGYLNFSSGRFDPAPLAGLNALYAAHQGGDVWPTIRQGLERHLDRLTSSQEAFRDATQARAVLSLVFDHVLPAYRQFHRDLLFHQSDETLLMPLFVGRVMEAVLRVGGPWEETQRIVDQTLQLLNDYVGHRPVAILEGHKVDVYPHERCRPIPLYIRSVGVGHGPLHDLVTKTLEILSETDPALLRQAMFDLDQLDELALDPRAYDFDHPVNKRPNYHFGQWDPHHIDSKGLYSRFVVHQVTVDALLQRVLETKGIARDELLLEGAAVLAGTMLMASGISGNGPGAYDSTVTLGSLMPKIADYRDAFYEQLLERIPKRHADRLRQEAQRLHQPFGAARQHLNGELCRRRATHRERVAVAKIFARMGYSEAAAQQVARVPVPAARMTCQVECLLAEFNHRLLESRLAECHRLLDEAWRVIRRGIECGAIVDPWNILGFDGNYSIFPAMENSVPDERVDELVQMVEQMLDHFSRLWSMAVARGDSEQATRTEALFDEFAQWWNQYAAHEVSTVGATPPLAAFQAARHVAMALDQWHRAGASAGDVGFWAPYVSQFESPRAYGLVIDALLERDDFSASRNLLVHWLSHADQVPLEDGTTSFAALARRWLFRLLELDRPNPRRIAEQWPAAAKFFDFLEANAGPFGQVPPWQGPGSLEGESELASRDEPLEEDEESDEYDDELKHLFDAAYEDVVYRDSTDDGIDASVFDTGGDLTWDELELALRPLSMQLNFLEGWADLWRTALFAQCAMAREGLGEVDEAMVQGWTSHLETWRADLMLLLESIHRWRLPAPSGDPEAILEYDRQRLTKETLLERVIVSYVNISVVELTVQSIRGTTLEPAPMRSPEEPMIVDFIAATVRKTDRRRLARLWDRLEKTLQEQPILYVPIARGGSPLTLCRVRLRQRLITELHQWLARSGLLEQSRQLVETSRQMERRSPVSAAAVTEFDSLFESGFRTLVQSLIESARSHPEWSLSGERQGRDACASADAPSASGPQGAAGASGQVAEPAGEAADEGIADATDREVGERSQRSESAPNDSGSKPRSSAARRASPEFVSQDAGDLGDVELELLEAMERITESMLLTWITHSRTLRLSVLEKVSSAQAWERLTEFIRRYGGEIFTQTFLTLGNIRGILHQGVDQWLRRLEEENRTDQYPTLFADLGTRLPRAKAVAHLTLILEAVMEGYEEYRDYNGTTTQSDRGECLYTLLDFLRLRWRYERVMWNMKPVVLAHEVLLRNRMVDTARHWRNAVAERIGGEADRYVERLQRLQRKYAMRLSTVADRLKQRFLQPLVVDQIRSLVQPAVRKIGCRQGQEAFEQLEQEVNELLKEPSGPGWDLPRWIEALDQEVEQVLETAEDPPADELLKLVLPDPPPPLGELIRRFRRWETQRRRQNKK